MTIPEPAAAVLDFWFGAMGDPERERPRAIWFKGTDEFDAAVRRALLDDYQRAAAGELEAWEEAAESALALVLLLDQVPRNIFRDTPRAYATDAMARAAAERALARGFDRNVPPVWRRFLYMPFHHSENLADQRRSVALFEAVPRSSDRQGSLRRYGHTYLDVIARFGRFPHRNAILGRESTPEEREFLAAAERLRRAQPEAC
ncbi:MAG: DUF924 family protein [Stellaceae bacterium]